MGSCGRSWVPFRVRAAPRIRDWGPTHFDECPSLFVTEGSKGVPELGGREQPRYSAPLRPGLPLLHRRRRLPSALGVSTVGVHRTLGRGGTSGDPDVRRPPRETLSLVHGLSSVSEVLPRRYWSDRGRVLCLERHCTLPDVGGFQGVGVCGRPGRTDRLVPLCPKFGPRAQTQPSCHWSRYGTRSRESSPRSRPGRLPTPPFPFCCRGMPVWCEVDVLDRSVVVRRSLTSSRPGVDTPEHQRHVRESRLPRSTFVPIGDSVCVR